MTTDAPIIKKITAEAQLPKKMTVDLTLDMSKLENGAVESQGKPQPSDKDSKWLAALARESSRSSKRQRE